MRRNPALQTLLAVVLAAIVGGLTAGPAHAAGAPCTGYAGGAKTVTFAAFAGHKVRATYRWCSPRPKQLVLPIGMTKLRGVSTPKISLPSRFPGSWGEDLSLTNEPTLHAWSGKVAKFRFTIKQTHIKIGPSSTYDFELRVYPGGKGRICFVDYGHNCSKRQ